MNQVLVIAGVGSGLSASIARKFAQNNWSIGLIARSAPRAEALAEEISSEDLDIATVQADVSVPVEVEAAFDSIRTKLGQIDVLVNHAAAFCRGGISDLSPSDFEKMWRVCAFGAFLCSNEVVPKMKQRNEGTIIFTGANVSKRAQKNAVGFSSAKFATRGLAQGMAKELGPEDIHVAHVVIHGQIDTPRNREFLSDVDPDSLLNPDEIAKTYWHLATQTLRSQSTEINVRAYP